MSFKELLQKIDENQKLISSFGKFSDEVLKKINYKLRLDWNYYSNRMEGGTLTKAETRSVMVGNIDVKGKPLKDVAEMAGHDKIVLDVLKMSKGELRISEKRIKDIHKAIMYEDNSELATQIGQWKKDPNEIIGYKNEKISFSQPADVADEIHILLNTTNAELDKIFTDKEAVHPIQLAAQFHIEYVTIHPFYDGNGRTSRILTNILLMACGYPSIIIKDEHKETYYRLLGDIQAYGGDRELFNIFIGERIVDSQQLILDAISGKSIEDEDDFAKELRLLKIKSNTEKITKSPKIIYEVFQEVKTTIWESVKQILKQTDDLFSDSSTEHFVNSMDELYPTRDLSTNPFEISLGPKKPKIFGHDVYLVDVKQIEWNHQKYGLIGSKNEENFIINLSVVFSNFNYSIILSMNKKIILEKDKEYNDLLISELSIQINKILKENILSEIKNRLSS